MAVFTEGGAALWLAVIASGLYHGANPGMGWPLAVSAALFERRAGALPKALTALALGHLLAMLGVLLPFAMLTFLVAWQREIQIGAAALLTGFGLYLLINPRHPRFLARIPPSRLMLWSFLIAVAHGAGLMLVPVYLGLCAPGEVENAHQAASDLMRQGVLTAVAVASLHTLAMICTGGAIAYAVYRWLGLRFLRMGWFDLDRVWAGSLVLVGIVALALTI
ncbi:MAG: hypothetical protein AAF371_02845 [Pseudomonadota bacterium]